MRDLLRRVNRAVWRLASWPLALLILFEEWGKVLQEHISLRNREE